MQACTTSSLVLGGLRSFARTTGGRAIVWCVVFAVVAYGLSGCLVAMMGSQHVHAHSATKVAPTWPTVASGSNTQDVVLEDFRRLRSPIHPVVHEHDHTQVHTHSDLERHHHNRGDATVLTLGADTHDAGASDEGSTSGAPHILALTGELPMAVLDPAGLTWTTAPPNAVGPWIADDMERPPRA